MRIGHGFDVHKLVETKDASNGNQQLILGGVAIEHELVLEGHSDADVLVHAIVDALLGAAGQKDIGNLFPETEQQYKGTNSLEFLEEVQKIINKQSMNISNIDCTIMAERPKLANHIEAMREKVAKALKITKEQINIKATTTEKLGFVGREEGIAAAAVCLLKTS